MKATLEMLDRIFDESVECLKDLNKRYPHVIKPEERVRQEQYTQRTYVQSLTVYPYNTDKFANTLNEMQRYAVNKAFVYNLKQGHDAFGHIRAWIELKPILNLKYKGVSCPRYTTWLCMRWSDECRFDLDLPERHSHTEEKCDAEN